MPSRSEAALGHILDNIRLARELAVGSDEATFVKDWRTFYAATRCLEIISEASRRLGDKVKERHPEVPWRSIADAGNVYRHGYEVVDPQSVWDTILVDLPTLEAAVMRELGSKAAGQTS